MSRISAFVDRCSAVLCDFSGAMLVAMAVLINVEVVARAEGRAKKEAEQAAAREALAQLSGDVNQSR